MVINKCRFKLRRVGIKNKYRYGIYGYNNLYKFCFVLGKFNKNLLNTNIEFRDYYFLNFFKKFDLKILFYTKSKVTYFMLLALLLNSIKKNSFCLQSFFIFNQFFLNKKIYGIKNFK